MCLGELLVGQGMLARKDVEAALQRQKQERGWLGTHLVAMGLITVDKLLVALRGQQDVDAALAMCARTLQRWQGMHGAGHPNTHRARYSHARTLLAAGRAADAVKHAEAALAGHRDRW